MRVKLQFQSPLIVGDKKISSNYIASKDYIQGSVIRAAFARVILNQCSAYHGELEEVTIDDEKGEKKVVSKKNWIHCRGEEDGYKEKYEVICKKCPYHKVCSSFSKIKFSFFYPKETSVIPLTSMCCKNKRKEHGFIDSLTQDMMCLKCKKGNNRVEFESGLRTAQGIYKAQKVVQTKTAINPYTRTSKDGMLFNLVSLSPICFEGEIEGIDDKDLALFETLRIGAYTSTGFGKCQVLYDSQYTYSDPTLNEVYAYSEEYKKHQKQLLSGDKEYLVVMLSSDAHIEIEVPKEYCTTAQYISHWEKYVRLESSKLHKVYFDTTLYRGYDTSSATNDYRAKAKYQINKGSILIYEFDDKQQLKDVYDKYYFGAYIRGKVKFTIGNECENGFGSCQIYCGEVKHND